MTSPLATELGLWLLFSLPCLFISTQIDLILLVRKETELSELISFQAQDKTEELGPDLEEMKLCPRKQILSLPEEPSIEGKEKDKVTGDGDVG